MNPVSCKSSQYLCKLTKSTKDPSFRTSMERTLSQILLYLNYLVRLAHNCSLSCPFKVMMLETLRELFWRKTFVQHEVPSGTSQVVGAVRLNLPVLK